MALLATLPLILKVGKICVENSSGCDLSCPDNYMLWHLKPSTHTHPFNNSLSGTTRESRYQKGNTNLDFTEARDSEWQWHQLGHMQACTSLQTDNNASTPPLSFLHSRCPSCCPTNSVKALKANRISTVCD